MLIVHPTVEIFFVFAFTFCRLRVYAGEEMFVRKLLAGQVEFCDEQKEMMDVDTRLMMYLVGQAKFVAAVV